MYTAPITLTATMSSITVSMRRKTLSWVGQIGPTSASAPRRKAVSVPMTTPQPWAASPSG